MSDPASRSLADEAAFLMSIGLRLIPVDGSKIPTHKWGHTVHSAAPNKRVTWWLKSARVRGWAIACGNRADGIYCIDIEAAGMEHPAIRNLVDTLPTSCLRRTPSGGVHIWVRAPGALLRTRKLAFASPARGTPVLMAELRGLSANPTKAGAYAVITGPERARLPSDFGPLALSEEDLNRLLDRVTACDQRSAEDRDRHRPARVPPTPTPTEEAGSNRAEAGRERIRRAPLGSRNDTINEEVFLATLRGDIQEPATPEERSVWVEAAVTSGEDPERASRTFDSAHSAATEQLCRAQEWAGQALRAARQRNRRPPANFEAVVAQLARDFGEHGPLVRVSARQLAERVNASYRTCARHLKRLVNEDDLRIVEQAEPEKGRTYRMMLNAQNVTVVHGPTPMDHCDILRVSAEVVNLRTSSAFITKRGEPNLPAGVAVTLAAIAGPSPSVKNLAARTDYTDSTIRRHLQILRSAGLVDFADPYRDIRLTDPNTSTALGEYCRAMGIQDRRAERRAEHENQRRGYREWLERTQGYGRPESSLPDAARPILSTATAEMGRCRSSMSPGWADSGSLPAWSSRRQFANSGSRVTHRPIGAQMVDMWPSAPERAPSARRCSTAAPRSWGLLAPV